MALILIQPHPSFPYLLIYKETQSRCSCSQLTLSLCKVHTSEARVGQSIPHAFLISMGGWPAQTTFWLKPRHRCVGSAVSFTKLRSTTLLVPGHTSPLEIAGQMGSSLSLFVYRQLSVFHSLCLGQWQFRRAMSSLMTSWTHSWGPWAQPGAHSFHLKLSIIFSLAYLETNFVSPELTKKWLAAICRKYSLSI